MKVSDGMPRLASLAMPPVAGAINKGFAQTHAGAAKPPSTSAPKIPAAPRISNHVGVSSNHINSGYSQVHGGGINSHLSRVPLSLNRLSTQQPTAKYPKGGTGFGEI